jgi:hypothetical protein
MSGTIPIRVSVILAAGFEGACPHLRPDMRCGNYDARPRVCRIYPAEISPNVALAPANKACPPETWSDDQPILMREGAPADRDLASLIRDIVRRRGLTSRRNRVPVLPSASRRLRSRTKVIRFIRLNPRRL